MPAVCDCALRCGPDYEQRHTPGTPKFDQYTVRALFVTPPTEHRLPHGRGAIRDTEVRLGSVHRSFARGARGPIAYIAHRPCGATVTIAVRSCNRYQSPLVLPLLPWRGSDTAQLHRFPYTHNGFYEFNDTLKRTFVKPRI